MVWSVGNRKSTLRIEIGTANASLASLSCKPMNRGLDCVGRGTVGADAERLITLLIVGENCKSLGVETTMYQQRAVQDDGGYC